MNTELVVAVIAAIVAVATAVFTTASTSRQGRKLEELRFEFDAAARREDRTLAAREVLDRYRRPLLASAVQLARRIENIRHRSFLAYLAADEHRAEVALKSVLYRFAAYLGWRELLSRELTYLEFEDSDRTRDVLGLLDDVRTKLSSARFDIVDGRPRLMLWTEEQSAIGGLMLREDGSPGVIGFERFFNRYPDDFSLWLRSFEQELQDGDVVDSTRLREVASSLDALIRRLDVGGCTGPILSVQAVGNAPTHQARPLRTTLRGTDLIVVRSALPKIHPLFTETDSPHRLRHFTACACVSRLGSTPLGGWSRGVASGLGSSGCTNKSASTTKQRRGKQPLATRSGRSRWPTPSRRPLPSAPG